MQQKQSTWHSKERQKQWKEHGKWRKKIFETK